MARVPQDITDISSAKQLLRYALAGQLEHLQKEHSDLSDRQIALGAKLGQTAETAAAALSHALRDGPSAELLVKLDRVIGALASDRLGTGGLSSLALRLSPEKSERPKNREQVRDSLTPQVPSSWTGEILKDQPSGELEVLVQASALLSAFATASGVSNGSHVGTIRERYRTEMERLVTRLILISVSPPTGRSYDAQIMLGNLAGYAFEPMGDWLESAVRNSPMAFRVWRTITKLVKLRGDGPHADELKGWVRQLIRDSAELRKRSLYAGRSLDLELALVVPAAWSPPGDDWVAGALRARAQDKEATVRERGTAAMGLWQRALEQHRDLAATEKDLRELIAEFKDRDSRPDVAAGLRWIAATLEHVIDNKEAVCNQWPDVDELWFRHVQEAAAELDNFGIPDHLLTGTKSLFLHMILQNAGVYRRQAIETVVTSGWSRPVATVLGSLLKNEKNEAWLRIRAEFALGFLQRPNRWVEADLTRACVDAYKNLARELDKQPADHEPPRSRITEVHTSLFAVGDCFGVPGAEDHAKSAREKLLPVLTWLADLEGDRAQILERATRAAAYLLIVTAQPRDNGAEDLSETLLKKLSRHPDDMTACLSKWALSFRFAPDGTVRPLLASADGGEPFDKSW